MYAPSVAVLVRGVYSDHAFRQRFIASPDVVLDELGAAPEERVAAMRLHERLSQGDTFVSATVRGFWP